MKTMILGALFLVMMPFASYAEGSGTGNGMNNGGDAIRQLFENARTAAVATLQELKWCSFKGSASADKVDWIIKNRSAIIEDIQKSQHLWVVDNQPTCAVTNQSSSAPIYLSYQTCSLNVGRELNKAVFVVLHETAHHFKVDNEREADEIAQMIMDAKLDVTCPNSPDITDPNICSSPPMTTADAAKYFTPGSVVANVPMDLKIYARIKRCVNISGCEPWKEWVHSSMVGDVTERPTKWSLVLNSTQKQPYFDGNFVADSMYRSVKSSSISEFNRGAPFKMPGDNSIYNLYFVGKSYRNEKSVALDNSSTRPGRLTRDCLWSSWSKVYTLDGGVTETVEVYAHARY